MILSDYIWQLKIAFMGVNFNICKHQYNPRKRPQKGTLLDLFGLPSRTDVIETHSKEYNLLTYLSGSSVVDGFCFAEFLPLCPVVKHHWASSLLIFWFQVLRGLLPLSFLLNPVYYISFTRSSFFIRMRWSNQLPFFDFFYDWCHT